MGMGILLLFTSSNRCVLDRDNVVYWKEPKGRSMMIPDAVFFTAVRPETNAALSTSTTQLQEMIVTALGVLI